MHKRVNSTAKLRRKSVGRFPGQKRGEGKTIDGKGREGGQFVNLGRGTDSSFLRQEGETIDTSRGKGGKKFHS